MIGCLILKVPGTSSVGGKKLLEVKLEQMHPDPAIQIQWRIRIRNPGRKMHGSVGTIIWSSRSSL